MSADDIDSLILKISHWIDEHSVFINSPQAMENDALYTSLSDLIFRELERFETRERNYN